MDTETSYLPGTVARKGWLWVVQSSGMKRHIVRQKSTNVSRENVASIFRIESSTLKIQAVYSSEISMGFYLATWRYIQKVVTILTD
jgi:hypothetical protein